MSRELSFVPYTPDRAAEWDRFVERSVNGTLFHSRAFLSYHPAQRFDDASVLVFQGDRLVSVIPAAWRDDDELGRLFNSHPGASYGGPVFSRKATGTLILDVVGALEEHARSAGAAAIKTRLPPHAFHHVPLCELDFALSFRGWQLWRRELSSFVTLAPDLIKLFKTSSRNQLRQAMRSGLTAVESEDFAQFFEVLADNLSRSHSATSTHTLAEIERLRELAPGRIRLFAATHGDVIAAATLAFVCNERAIHTFYMASRKEHQHDRPLNLAIYALMQWALDNGFARINFGISTEGSDVLNRGLLKFKEGLGARGVCRDTFVKPL